MRICLTISGLTAPGQYVVGDHSRYGSVSHGFCPFY